MRKEDREQAAECKEVTGLVDAVLGRNKTLGSLPIGWKSWREASVALTLVDAKDDAEKSLVAQTSAPARWLGFVLTVVAISLGASFWFDLLGRLVNMRHGMRKRASDPVKPDGKPVQP